MSRGRTAKVLTHRYDGSGVTRQPDQLIVEEPLEIQLDGVLVSTTMRTPGHDFELAAGFCFTEGLLGPQVPVRQCRYCGTGSAVESEFNVVTVETGGVAPLPRPRLTTITSACGMCGTTAIDELRERLHALPATAPFSLDVLARVPDTVTSTQQLFYATGAVHAAVAFDRSGTPLLAREDIGRHNAVDKVVGRFLLDDRLPATGMGLYVSGRASFEIVQKAWAAGFSTVVAVSAPSSLAVSAARLAGMTLCGFARGGRLNVYAPEELVREAETSVRPSAAMSSDG
ncbi:MAG TPA: formate dehydrogenase accessory sulfurtransferase FdhD [Acidimicrobiales bacterium]|nr:formate dehydrogenase accessory sulfurtransferase FdhD [Acidimicrobiales bacterium]